jgi:hypothetical protein
MSICDVPRIILEPLVEHDGAHRRIFVIVGGIVMLVGALDPMEGSLVILAGSGLVTLGTFLSNSGRGLFIQWACILVSIAVGVGALFLLSAWGYGGTSEHSMWWGVLILPYPVAWAIGITCLLFRLIRTMRHRHAAA